MILFLLQKIDLMSHQNLQNAFRFFFFFFLEKRAFLGVMV